MSNTTSTLAPSVAVAPAHPAGTGHATKGGHVVHWRAQPAFDPASTLQLTSAHNPWRPNAPGYAFYAQVLAPLGLEPTTVQAVLAAAHTAGFKPGVAQGHLRWLYTWGNYMLVNGALHPAFGGNGAVVEAPAIAPVEAAPVAPVAKRVRRGKK
jgi:hypothetical protein